MVISAVAAAVIIWATAFIMGAAVVAAVSVVSKDHIRGCIGSDPSSRSSNKQAGSSSGIDRTVRRGHGHISGSSASEHVGTHSRVKSSGNRGVRFSSRSPDPVSSSRSISGHSDQT
jgi:hypothetical protein